MLIWLNFQKTHELWHAEHCRFCRCIHMLGLDHTSCQGIENYWSSYTQVGKTCATLRAHPLQLAFAVNAFLWDKVLKLVGLRLTLGNYHPKWTWFSLKENKIFSWDVKINLYILKTAWSGILTRCLYPSPFSLATSFLVLSHAMGIVKPGIFSNDEHINILWKRKNFRPQNSRVVEDQATFL